MIVTMPSSPTRTHHEIDWRTGSGGSAVILGSVPDGSVADGSGWRGKLITVDSGLAAAVVAPV
ncbi:hypothetical protein GCM10027298_21520 [Epidermidibacterium keratini]